MKFVIGMKGKKGVSVLIATVILILLSIGAVAPILTVINPVLSRGRTQTTINEATDVMRLLDRTIRQVASQGTGALDSMVVQVSDGSFVVRNATGIEYILETDANPIPTRSLIRDGNIKTASGFTALGLVGYWRFDEGSGTVVNDSSGKENDGTLYSGNWISGKYGNGLSFVDIGRVNNVTIPSSVSLSIVNQITVEAWVKLNGTSQTMIRKNPADWLIEWGVAGSNTAGNAVQWYVKTSAGTLLLGPNVSNNVWTHVVGTYDGSSMNLYLNGTLLNSTSKTGDLATSKSTLHFGGWTLEKFNGTIDEVRIYRRALNESEIKENYNLPSTVLKISLDYDNIIIKGTSRWGKGTSKICIEKLGTQLDKAVVEVRTC